MGRAGAVAVAGTLIITSKTLPAAIKTSVCTRGAAGTVVAPATCTPGTVLPSSAIRSRHHVGNITLRYTHVTHLHQTVYPDVFDKYNKILYKCVFPAGAII